MPQWIEMTRSPEYSPKIIGQELVFLQNDFRELLSDLGDVAFMDKIEKAMLGETIIIGGYIRTELIAANSIVGDKISSNAITARHIQAGAITADKIAANSITADKIDSNAIVARHIQAGAITADKIAANSITADKIDSNAIVARHIQAGAITADKIAAQSITADKINVASLSAISANLGTVTAGNISGVTITGGSLNINNRFRVASNGDMTSTSGTIGGYTISSTSLTGNNVTLGAGSITINGVTLQPYTTASVLYVNGQTRFIGRMSASTIIPLSNTTYDLGMTGARWNKLYIDAGGIDEGSDLRQKQNVRDIPDDLVLQLAEIKPKMYEANGKIHFGYIAQDVERALYKYALNKVGYKKARQYVDDFNLLGRGESYLSLVYSQIAVLKEAEMQRRIDELEKKLKTLEEQISN